MNRNKKPVKNINANSIRLVALLYSIILIILFIFISPSFKTLYSAKNPDKYKIYLSKYMGIKTPNSISLIIGARLQEINTTYNLYRDGTFYTTLHSDIFTDTSLIPYKTYTYQVIVKHNNIVINKSNKLIVQTQNSQINPSINPNHINYSRYSAFGDSITQGYDTTLSYFQTISKYLKNKYDTISFNDGVGGNTTYNLLQRIDGEIQQQKPTLVTLMIGTNDLRLGTKNNPTITAFAYKQNLIQILNTISPSKNRTVIIFLIPYLENFNYPGYSAGSYQRLKQFNNIIIGVANTFGIPYINENPGLESQNSILAPDGIHPNNKGDSIISSALKSELSRI